MTTQQTALPAMTIGDYDHRFRMRWSIYDSESYNRFDAIPFPDFQPGSPAHKRMSEEYDKIALDMSAPEGCPDGIHTVFHKAGPYSEGQSVGAIVRDGKFEPHSTDAVAYEAVCHSYGVKPSSRGGDVNHVYIEQWIWHPERRALELITGS